MNNGLFENIVIAGFLVLCFAIPLGLIALNVREMVRRRRERRNALLI